MRTHGAAAASHPPAHPQTVLLIPAVGVSVMAAVSSFQKGLQSGGEKQ